ncbi:TPA: YSIRK-type signal peptide-containing protein, partial [Staphylococcus pseudintermedius]
MYKNEKEKHSIRKLSIGAASVIVGGLMYGVLGNDEAQANEDVTETTGRNSVTTQASEQHLQVEAVPQEGNNVNVSAVKVPTNTAKQAQEDVASVSDVKAHADDALQAQESSHTDGVSSEFKQETAYANPQTAETVKPNSEAAHQSEDEDKQKPVSFSRKEDETMLQQQQVEAKNVVSAEEVSQEENTQVIQSPQDVEQHVGGKDISNEVVVDRSDIKGFNSETTIRPHQGQGVPPESITIDPNMWEEISINDTMVRKYDGGYSLNLDTSKNQKYAIYYEGAYDAQAETLLYRTYIQSLNSYYPFSYQKMNGVKFYENSASGSGELKPKPPEQPKPEPEIQADVVDIIEDSHVIDIGWNTAVG